MLKRLTALFLVCVLLLVCPFAAMAGGLAADDKRCDILNSAGGLDCVSPQSPELNEYIDGIMVEMISEDMELSAKLAACFDYVKDNTSYGSHMANLNATVGGVTCDEIYQKYGEVEGFGAVALAANTGMCNAYASAFIMMARKLGYDAYLVEGETKDGGGGYAYHKWCEIGIDGEIYVFDPQLDQSLERSGLGEYTVFCVKYDDIPGKYILY